jgi:hypothetical protein
VAERRAPAARREAAAAARRSTDIRSCAANARCTNRRVMHFDYQSCDVIRVRLILLLEACLTTTTNEKEKSPNLQNNKSKLTGHSILN